MSIVTELRKRARLHKWSAPACLLCAVVDAHLARSGGGVVAAFWWVMAVWAVVCAVNSFRLWRKTVGLLNDPWLYLAAMVEEFGGEQS